MNDKHIFSIALIFIITTSFLAISSATEDHSQATYYDGTSNTIYPNTDLSSGEYTIVGWVKTSEPARSEVWRAWISKYRVETFGGFYGDSYSSNGAHTPFELGIGDGRPGSGNGPFFIVWNNGVGVVNIADSKNNIRDGEWHFIAATYRTGSQNLYLDGSIVGSASYSGPLPQTDSNILVGGADMGAYHTNWKGYLDGVRVYNYVLSDKEIISFMKSGTSGNLVDNSKTIEIILSVSIAILVLIATIFVWLYLKYKKPNPSQNLKNKVKSNN